jgi:hypothetical protein
MALGVKKEVQEYWNNREKITLTPLSAFSASLGLGENVCSYYE